MIILDVWGALVLMGLIMTFGITLGTINKRRKKNDGDTWLAQGAILDRYAELYGLFRKKRKLWTFTYWKEPDEKLRKRVLAKLREGRPWSPDIL